MTDKNIREKMYNWIIQKGVSLKDNDRKEIKEIMNEYKDYFDKPVKVEIHQKESKWKPYPITK